MRSWSCLLAAVVIGTTLLLPVVQNVPIGSMEEDDFEDSSRASNDGSVGQKISSSEEMDGRGQASEDVSAAKVRLRKTWVWHKRENKGRLVERGRANQNAMMVARKFTCQRLSAIVK